MNNNLFQDSQSEAGRLKMGFYGKNGSGKTYTASLVAIGLYNHCKGKKPVYFLDSETGSDYVKHLFDKASINLRVAKTRAFRDLLDAVEIAQKEGFCLVVDSISHYWDELVDSYRKKKNLSHLTIRHWGDIKPMWREFSERYVSSDLHIIVCGRSGDVWEDIPDEEGVMELKKVGTRMRTEREMAYEPSLLVEMSQDHSPKQGYNIKAFVQKDRFDQLNFEIFTNPKFEDFLPHIQCLNLGGKHHVLDRERNSEEMFQAGSNSGYNRMKKKDAILDELSEMIKYYYPGQDKDSKKARIDIFRKYFDGYGWEKVTQIQDVEKLDAQHKKIRSDLQKQFPDKAEEKPEKENKKEE